MEVTSPLKDTSLQRRSGEVKKALSFEDGSHKNQTRVSNQMAVERAMGVDRWQYPTMLMSTVPCTSIAERVKG